MVKPKLSRIDRVTMTTSTVFKQKIDSSPDRSTCVVGGPSLAVEPALRMGGEVQSCDGVIVQAAFARFDLACVLPYLGHLIQALREDLFIRLSQDLYNAAFLANLLSRAVFLECMRSVSFVRSIDYRLLVGVGYCVTK